MVLAHQPAVPAPSSVRDGNKVVLTQSYQNETLKTENHRAKLLPQSHTPYAL